MTEFKGTKGKWVITEGYPNGVEIDAIRIQTLCNQMWDIAAVWDDLDSDQSKANALLISKAPDMLEEIQESLIDIQILRDQIAKESEINHRFEVMAGIMDNWINRKKQLIKEATEL